MKKEVIMTFQLEGFHNWPEAVDDCDFLKYPHRHMFHFKIWERVDHNDRDIEIITRKRKIKEFLEAKYGSPCAFGRMSCEDIAEKILEIFDCEAVEVLEDGENGAIVYV